jgi:hypothetical protein
MCSIITSGDLLSMSLSDIDDLLPDLSDDGTPDLLFLQTKIQAPRTASAAPTKMQPIAMPIVWPRESPDLSFDEGDVVCTKLGDVGVAAIVGKDKLWEVDVCGDNVSFGDVSLSGVVNLW